MTSELALFTYPTIQQDIEAVYYQEVYPSHKIENSIEFYYKGSSSDYVALRYTTLNIRVKLTRPAAYTAIDENVTGKKCFLENMPISSIFSKVELYLNDTLVEGSHSLYPEESHIKTVLKFGKAVKDTELEAWGYAETDNALRNRMSSAENQYFEFVGPVFMDFFEQSQLLVPLVDIRLKFTVGEKKFFRRAEVGPLWGFSIESAVLKVKKIKVNYNILADHSRGIVQQNVVYPIQETKLISIPIAKDNTNFSYDNLFRGYSPKVLISVLVSEADSLTNPFKFQNFKLNYYSVIQDGINVHNESALEPDFENNLYTREYASLFENLQLFGKNRSLGITMKEFKETKCIFVTNLCRDMDLNGIQPPNYNNLRLEMKFAAPLPTNVNLIIMAVCDGVIEIDKNLRVHINK